MRLYSGIIIILQALYFFKSCRSLEVQMSNKISFKYI